MTGERNDEVLNALKFAALQVEVMHGSALGMPDFPHCVLVQACACAYAQHLRTLRALINMRRYARLVVKNGAQDYTDDNGKDKVVPL